MPEDVTDREEGVEVRQSHDKTYSMEGTVGCSKKHTNERFVMGSESAENLRCEKFNSLNQLTREFSDELLHCYFCEYSCQTKQGLSRHIHSHLPAYVCMVCDAKFRSERTFVAHNKSEHSGSDKGSAQPHSKAYRVMEHLQMSDSEFSNDFLHCYFCEYSSQNKAGLSKHVQRHLPPHICSMCDSKFRSERKLLAHNKCEHPESKNPQNHGPKSNEEMVDTHSSDDKLSSDLLHCYFCDYSTFSKVGLSKHIQGHLPPHICSMCDLKFRSTRKLLAHNKCEHPESKTPQKRRATIDKVMEDTHSSENKPFSENSTRTEVGISKHVYHSPPHMCSVCDAMFHSEHELLAHEKCKHPENEKSQKHCAKSDGFLENQQSSQGGLNCELFYCYFCLHSFQTKLGLVRHLQSHLPSYICTICNAKFRTERTLLAHEKGGHFEIKNGSEFSKDLLHCYLCDYSSRNKAGLSKHIKGHLPPLICSICHTKFRSEQKLAAHEKREHPKSYKRQKLSVKPHKFKEDTRLSDVFKCHLCKYVAKNWRHLSTHVEQHKETTVDEEPSEFRCYHCQWSTAVWDDLVEHMKDNHLPSVNNCTLCSFKANTRIMLIRHLMETHKLEKPYLCDVCDYSSKFASGLKSHKAKHTGEMRYACNMCDFRSDFVFHLTKHRQEHSDKKGEKRFDCDVCTYSATTFYNLQQHRRIHTGEKPYACDMCNYRSARLVDRNAHRRTHTGEKPYMCDICDYRSGRSYRLKQHRRIHFGEKPYACDLCDYRATRNQSVMDHMRYHHNHTGGKPFACDTCNYKTVRKSDLRKHVLTHKGNKKQKKLHKCEICNVAADSETTLLAHMKTHERIHSGDVTRGKPYACDLCSYHAETLMEMSVHKRTHPSDKPHPCALCDYRASKAEYLRLHYRKHTGEKPYACEKCDFRTHLSQNLQYHLKLHQNKRPFPCDSCDYSAARASRLACHKRIHTGEKPFACSVCAYRSTCRQSLRTHMRSHTGDLPYACDWCDSRTKSAALLALHKKKEHPANLYACGECSFQDFSRHKVEQHLINCHPTIGLGRSVPERVTNFKATVTLLFNCPECSFNHRSRSLVEDHMSECHLEVPVAECKIWASAQWDSD